MYSYTYGGKGGTRQHLEVANDLVVVRTQGNQKLNQVLASKDSKALLTQLSPVTDFPEAGVTVLRVRGASNRRMLQRDHVRQKLNQEAGVRFSGKALIDSEDRMPVVYTENLFVKFKDSLSEADCSQYLQKYRLVTKRKLGYAQNAYFVAAAEGTGLEIFQIAQNLLDENDVEYCHPELIRQARRRSIASQQWHLQESVVNGATIKAHVNVNEAWEVTRGAGTLIAIIDDGFAVDHEEFASPGKIVAPRDMMLNSDDPRPKDSFYPENHGTACAGVACADGNHQASGVAPEARLMPIRMVANLGSQAEADAFQWAADNGADVISCSWGPADGDWWNPNDAAHQRKVALPDSTRLAIDYAVSRGRAGKGCVITWAAGNGNESVDNDGYASYERVIAVAACNDRGTRSVYSDYGDSIWCAFPSNDMAHLPFDHLAPLTPGIWTTDREGQAGYNPGELNPEASPPGDDSGNYTNSFGGTSSACPGVAGIAALIIAANPNLRWDEVKQLLRQAAIQIDIEGGAYGPSGHSPLYGYGRPDAAKAVALAQAFGNADPVKYETLRWEATAAGTLAATGAEKLYRVELSGKNATVLLNGPNDVDFDLYVKKNEPPTTRVYDYRAYTSSSDESLAINSIAPGLYFILVRSYRGGGDFTLKVN